MGVSWCVPATFGRPNATLYARDVAAGIAKPAPGGTGLAGQAVARCCQPPFDLPFAFTGVASAWSWKPPYTRPPDLTVIVAQPVGASVVSRCAIQRPFCHSARTARAAPAPSQSAAQSHTSPLRSSSPLRVRRNFTGTVRPFDTGTTRPSPTGSSKMAPSRRSVTATENEALEWLPLASVAVHVTVVVPTANVEPEAGAQPTHGEPSTTSRAEGAPNVTTAPPASAVTTDRSDGIPDSEGAVVSRTVTAKDPEAVAPALSIAEHEMVVDPSGRTAPGAGRHVTAGSGSSSASVADTLKFEVQPPVVSASTVSGSGSVRTGFVFDGAAGTTSRKPTDGASDSPSAGERKADRGRERPPTGGRRGETHGVLVGLPADRRSHQRDVRRRRARKLRIVDARQTVRGPVIRDGPQGRRRGRHRAARWDLRI